MSTNYSDGVTYTRLRLHKHTFVELTLRLPPTLLLNWLQGNSIAKI
jgi:hypothetical protein